jgi:hypothetical protein
VPTGSLDGGWVQGPEAHFRESVDPGRCAGQPSSTPRTRCWPAPRPGVHMTADTVERECELRPGSVGGCGAVIPGHTFGMKTAISLPDDTYEQATRQAAELGISRSEFFARAARNYLDQLAVQSLTRQINEALQGAPDASNAAAAAAAGRRYLAAQDDDW